jgi:hypothetical protein
MQVLDFIILLHYYIITLKNTSNPQMSFCFYEVNFVRGVALDSINKVNEVNTIKHPVILRDNLSQLIKK